MTAYRTNATLSEEDVYSLVQRYGAATIFTLLLEISQSTDKDLTVDWRTLVKATSTGISNAREYQMLWRHLAYGEPLENVEDGTEPLSDESDLEFELEATPTPSKEALAEVDFCVKVLLSSAPIGDFGPAVATTVDAPSLTDKADEQILGVSSEKQQFACLYGPASVSTQKQPLRVGVSKEGVDGNGPLNSGFPTKKKRKLWTKEEDMELIAAVQKFGEGNWANILRGDFKHDRTASQLSQRWAIIRKRQTNLNQNSSKSTSEEMLAAQKAISMALDMPIKGSLPTILSGTAQAQKSSSLTAMAGATTEPSARSPDASTPESLNQNQAASVKGAANLSSNLLTTQRKAFLAKVKKPSISPNTLIKAAAFAAGGRIATPSTAASLFKAARSKNAVHIRHGGSDSLRKSPGTTTIATTITESKLSQLKINSGKAVNLPPSESTKLLSLELKNPGMVASCDPLENAEQKRSIVISAVDVNELLAGEARGGEKEAFGASGEEMRELNEKHQGIESQKSLRNQSGEEDVEAGGVMKPNEDSENADPHKAAADGHSNQDVAFEAKGSGHKDSS